MKGPIGNSVARTLVGTGLFIGLTAAGPETIQDPASTHSIEFPLGLEADKAVLPPGNPLSRAKIELGKRLFFDPRLSRDGTRSCASCHKPEHAFADDRAVSTGVSGQRGRRNAPTLINRVFSSHQFHDGRAQSLEAQVAHSITEPTEMGMPDTETLVGRLRSIKGYRSRFAQVFPSGLNMANISKAIAAFERTLVSGNSRFDRFIQGDSSALSPSERRGFDVFQGIGNCIYCHGGFNFTDEGFHNTGIGMDRPNPDPGRMGVTDEARDRGRFKTPTLRELVHTAPYMHDGSKQTLKAVIEFYSAGGIDNPYQDDWIGEISFSAEQRADLLAFLKSLSGQGWQTIPPGDVPSWGKGSGKGGRLN